MKQKKDEFRIWPYFAKHKLAIFCYVLLSCVYIGITFLQTYFAAEFLTNVTQGDYSLAIRTMLIIATFWISEPIIFIIQNTIYQVVVAKIKLAMRTDLVERCFALSSKTFSDHNLGNFTQRISSDPNRIIDEIINIFNRVESVTGQTVILIYILILNWKLGLILVGMLIVTLIIENVRKRVRVKTKKKLNQLGDKNSALVVESIKGERDVKSLYMENAIKEEVKNTYRDYSRYSAKTNLKLSTIGNFSNLLAWITAAVTLLLGVKFVDKGFMTLTAFLFLNNNIFRAGNLGYTLSYLITSFTEIKISKTRINELYGNNEYEIETFGARHLNKVKGKIEFKNVSFKYVSYVEIPVEEQLNQEKYNRKHHIKDHIATRRIQNENKVFENLNFVIEPNTTVAFVGKSGSGKSTILNLISKIYSVDSGKIKIDGVDIETLDKDTIRKSITLVNQSPYIFDMTIKENLLLANPGATDEEIDAVLKYSALDTFVNSLPEKVDTKVGEGGIKLSGGQKQRLAIARALIKNSAIILFDESTSSLDNFAQNTIKQSIDNIKGKATVVIVAHRLTTIKNADKIFYLEDGKIVDVGTFAELYKRNKTFKAMFKAENI